MFQGFTVAGCGVTMSIMHRNIPGSHATLQKRFDPRCTQAPSRLFFWDVTQRSPFVFPAHDATTSFKPDLLLLSDEPTTLVIFKLDLNYVLINKLTLPRDPFDAAKIASLAAISPTAVQIIPFLLLRK